jgi:hypothetical protein
MRYEERKHASKIGEKKPWPEDREKAHPRERQAIRRFTHVLVRRANGRHPDAPNQEPA